MILMLLALKPWQHYLSPHLQVKGMLVKGGTGSFSMVGGLVMSAPQPQSHHRPQPNPLAALVQRLLRRQT